MNGPIWELEPDECVLAHSQGRLVCVRAHNKCQPTVEKEATDDRP